MRMVQPNQYEVVERSYDASNHKRLGVSEEMIGLITSMLTHFYSNPEYATARELIVNGLDACNEAGVTPRIDVKTTGTISATSEVSFADCGIGMTPHIFKNIFAAYGESTKRDSDFLTGGFGLGSKTPYTMSDTFTVITSRDGIKTLGIFTRDEDDFGNADFIDMGETDERGTTVTIPLSRVSVRAMEEAVRRAAYAMPPNTVYLNGEACASLYDNSFKIEGHGYVTNDSHHFLAPMNVLMGGILYPLDNIEFFGNPVNPRSRYWGRPQGTIVFTAGVDEFIPTPQRDQLRDIRSNREKVAEKFNNLRDVSLDYMNNYFSENFSHMEAIVESSKHANWFYLLTQTNIKDVCEWNGKTLSTSIKVPGKTIYKKKYRQTLSDSDSNEIHAHRVEAGQVFAYVGVTEDDLAARKVIMDFNARARASADSIVSFILLDDGEVIENEWLTAGGENSQVELVTREQVFAVTPRARSRRTQNYNITYDIWEYDEDGNRSSVESRSLDEIEDNVAYISGGDGWNRWVRQIPGFFAEKSILVLRSGQQLDVMLRRLPGIVDLRESMEAAAQKRVEEVIDLGVISNLARNYTAGRSQSHERYRTIANMMVGSRFAQIYDTYYAGDRVDIDPMVTDCMRVFSGTEAMREKMERVEEMTRANDLGRRYPLLVNWSNLSEEYLAHCRIYIQAVERMEQEKNNAR